MIICKARLSSALARERGTIVNKLDQYSYTHLNLPIWVCSYFNEIGLVLLNQQNFLKLGKFNKNSKIF